MFCFADTVMKIYIKTMTEDDDKEVVAQACMAVADIMKDFGYMAVEPCKCAHSGSFNSPGIKKKFRINELAFPRLYRYHSAC